MPAKNNELKIIRVFDAPLKTVWEAWTDPAQVAKWWGPRGFTITHHSKDLRSGGHWHYTMHGPDGTDYPNTTHYLEVIPYTKLVYDHGGHADRPPLFRVTVLFSEVGGKTKMDMTMTTSTPEALAEIKVIINKHSGNATWDRLAEYLEKTTHHKEQFIINRSFAAAPAVVFDLWTKLEHFARWLPPAGFTMEITKGKILPGETVYYRMAGDAFTMYGRIHYLTIRKPDLLEYTQQFLDEHGNLSRHPKLSAWPATMLSTVTFTEEEPESTRVTVTWEPADDATPEEIAAFVALRGSMTLGWTGSFNKLEELLTVP